jgi:Xaa-Pro dipeptidase
VRPEGFTRRAALTGAGGLAGALALSPIAKAAAAPGISPISAAEHRARIAKLHGLLAAANAGPLIVEAGATLRYFTGVQWRLSERPTIGVLGAGERPILVTPAFEAPSVRESLIVDAEVLPWEEDQRATDIVAAALRRAGGTRPIALDPELRFFVSDGLKRALPGRGFIAGERFVRACRMFKSDHELALMQAANDITLKALGEVHGKVEAGMRHEDIAALMDQASLRLGAHGIEFSLVLLNEASAYPHGSKAPQAVRPGSTILMDCGCNLFGYQSDISRT